MVGGVAQELERGRTVVHRGRHPRSRADVVAGLCRVGGAAGGGEVVPAGLQVEAAGKREVRQRAGQTIRGVVGLGGGGRQGGPKVVGDLFEGGQPVIGQRRLDASGAVPGPVLIPPEDRGPFSGGELGGGEDPDGVEQVPTGAPGADVRHDEAAVDQTAENVGDGGFAARRRHRHGGGQVEPAGEHGQLPEHRPLLVVEQLVAPGDDRADGRVPGVDTAGAAEQPQLIIDDGTQTVQAERSGPRRGDLDGQRHAVQAVADRRYGRRLEVQLTVDRARPVDEEA